MSILQHRFFVWIKLLGMLLLPPLLTACSGGPGGEADGGTNIDQWQSEGTSISPVVVTLNNPYYGEVSGEITAATIDTNSYYMLSVTPGEHYFIELTNMSDNVDLYVYDDAGLSTLLCESSNFSPKTSDDYCTNVNPVSTATLYIRVFGGWTNSFFEGSSGGANYTLTVKKGYIGEGSYDTPQAIAEGVPYDGQVGHSGTTWGTPSGSTSYFSLPVDIKAHYTISMTSLTDNADLSVGSCVPGASGTTEEQCTVTPATSPVNFYVYGDYAARAGSAFTLTAIQTHSAYVAEGTLVAPMDLSGLLPYTGQVDTTNSYYSIPVTAGKSYRVKITGLDANVSLFVDDVLDFGYPNLCESHNLSISDEICIIEPVPSNTIYVRIKGSDTGGNYGASYVISVEEIVYPAEGTIDSPVLLGTAPTTTHAGSVDNFSSYYKATVLNGQAYRVTASAMVADVDIYVYDDVSYSTLLCSATASSTTDEFCITDPKPSTTDLYIRIDGNPSANGSTFNLSVRPQYFNQGSIGTPLILSLNAVNEGEVDVANSYYRVDATVGDSYRVTLDNMNANANLYIYSDSAFGVWDCGSVNYGTVTDECVVTIPSNGNLYIRVSGDLSGGLGTPFTISFTPALRFWLETYANNLASVPNSIYLYKGSDPSNLTYVKHIYYHPEVGGTIFVGGTIDDPTSGDVYYLRIIAGNSANSGAYSIWISDNGYGGNSNGRPKSPDDYEVDDTAAEATPLIVNVGQDHTLEAGGNEDWFVFTVP